MQLSIQHVIPIPLKDRLASRQSGIWQSSASFRPGEWIFIQAPSGTGKTTLIHLLYGLRTDYNGTITWDGQPLAGMPAGNLSRLRTNDISIIFQDMRLFPGLTAWENLEAKRLLTNTVSAQQVEEWLARLGMADKKNNSAATLSYGEQQRIAIVRSLLQPFSWLLMDEPFSHLDNANTQKAAALIAEVVTERKAGLILADLDTNTFFNYTKTIQL